MDPVGKLTLILLLSFLAEGLTEYFARPFLSPRSAFKAEPPADPADIDPDAAPAPPPTVISPMWLRYVSMIVGIALSFAYRTDLLAWFGFHAYHPAIGMALSGILIGRGSNYMHDMVDRYFQPTPKPLDWF